MITLQSIMVVKALKYMTLSDPRDRVHHHPISAVIQALNSKEEQKEDRQRGTEKERRKGECERESENLRVRKPIITLSQQ